MCQTYSFLFLETRDSSNSSSTSNSETTIGKVNDIRLIMASEPIIQAFDNACVRIRAEGLHSIKELAERVKHNGLESEPRVQRGWRRVQNALRETTERQALLQEVQMIFAPSTPQSGVNSSTAPINITAPADSNSTTSRRKRSAMELPNAPLSKRTIKHRNGKNDLLSRLDRIASTAETSSDEAKKSLEQDLRRGQKLKDRMNVVHRKRRAKWIKIKEVECKTFQAAVDKGWIKGFIPGEDVRKLSKTPKECKSFKRGDLANKVH